MLHLHPQTSSHYACAYRAWEQNGTGLWCNGNTTDFGSVILGSSPSRPTKKPLKYLRGFFIYAPIVIYILKVTTGLTAWVTRSSLMLPLKKCASPFLPCVHIPIRSAFMLLAKCNIPFSTFTSLYTCMA